MSDIDRKIAEFAGCTVWMNNGSSFAGAKYKGELIAHSELGLRNWFLSSDGMRAMMEAAREDRLLILIDDYSVEIMDTKIHKKICTIKHPHLPTAVYEAVKQYGGGK